MRIGWQLKSEPFGPELERLTVPDPAAGRHPGALVRVKELKAWISTLDGAHPLLACKEIHAQAELLSRCPGKCAALPDLVEQFEQPILGLHAHVDEIMSAPLNDTSSYAAQQVLNAYSKTLMEVANLHKRLINDLLDSPKGPTAAQLVAAMEILAWQIKIHTTRYQSSPPETWRDMLQLLKITSFAGLLKQASTRPGQAEVSASSLFYGTLLYQLCDTMQLTPQATWQLFSRTLSYADKLEMRPAASCAQGIPLDMTGSIAPFVFARRNGAHAGMVEQRLYVEDLLDTLDSEHVRDQLSELVMQDLLELQRSRVVRNIRPSAT